MAIALVASALLGSGIARTSTPSYTVGASSNLLVVSIASAAQITGISYGGNALTISSVEDTTDTTWVTLGYLLTPPTGAHTFAFTAASGSLTAFAADYSGVGSADGTFVTNNEIGGASLTTNVALAGANEWVMCAAITGHLTNTFSTTTNQTVRQQDQGFLSGALYDSAAGFGSGTIGFVTTVTGSSPRIWVVMQAFKPSGAASNNGSLSETFADFTLAGTGTAPAKATLAETFADFTLVGTGKATAKATLAETFADFTLVGTGTAPASNNGRLAETFADFTLAGIGKATAKASLAETFADFVLAGSGTGPAPKPGPGVLYYGDAVNALQSQQRANLAAGMAPQLAQVVYLTGLYNLQTLFINVLVNGLPYSGPTLLGNYNANRVATFMAIVSTGAPQSLWPAAPPATEFTAYGYAYGGQVN